MKNFNLFAAAAAVAVLAGCQHTHVDQVSAGDGMKDWYADIKEKDGVGIMKSYKSVDLFADLKELVDENVKHFPSAFDIAPL